MLKSRCGQMEFEVQSFSKVNAMARIVVTVREHGGESSQNPSHDFAGDIRQPVIAAFKPIRQLRVVDAKQV